MQKRLYFSGTIYHILDSSIISDKKDHLEVLYHCDIVSKAYEFTRNLSRNSKCYAT